ncbi:hypothetical protein RB213_004430 [Colletotrichum asianum]
MVLEQLLACPNGVIGPCVFWLPSLFRISVLEYWNPVCSKLRNDTTHLHPIDSLHSPFMMHANRPKWMMWDGRGRRKIGIVCRDVPVE